jgi:glycine hydroxymethyltransferase
MNSLLQQDPDIYTLIQKETNRQSEGLEMIPSENHTSQAVIEALGSRLTDKYSEGYPGARYYGGCEFVDEVENLARERAKQLFGCTHANVQPHSGGPANMAAYVALMEPGETLLGMKLFHGGHMTHGLKVNYSGRFFSSVQYGCRADGYIDIDEVRRLAHEHKPKVIVSGGSAYPRQYPWADFSEIAAEIGAFHLADMSHVGGLVAGGAHPSPVGIADIVTSTTHKTLRGPRGAIILANGNPSTPLVAVERSKENIPTLIDRAIIPGLQGGPHNHQTAGIAVALKEAMQPEFKIYAHQVVTNAKVLADELRARGCTLITGGTDTHLLLIDLTNKNLTGQQGVDALSAAGITVNKNTFAGDTRKAFDPSGIRLGTPALTTRGMKETEMKTVAGYIDRAITHANDAVELERIHAEVKELCSHFALPR